MKIDSENLFKQIQIVFEFLMHYFTLILVDGINNVLT